MWDFLNTPFLSEIDEVCSTEEKGTRLKGIICEKCGTCYAYLMVRFGQGMQSYDYAYSSEDAKLRAEKKAHRNLGYKLRWESDVAPCPECHWVQSNMCLRAKYIILKWILWPAIWGGTVLIGGVAVGIVFAYWLILTVAVAVGLFFLIWATIRYIRFDINSRPDIRNLFLRKSLAYGLWTKKEVEKLMKQKDCELDCSYALLDWEREKLNRSEQHFKSRESI